MTSRTSQTTFDRALALLDSDESFQRSPRVAREPDNRNERDMSVSGANLTSPSRRRNRTSPTSPTPASPLRDYLNRHSIQLGGSPDQSSPSSLQRTAEMGRQGDPNRTPRGLEETTASDSQDPFIDDTIQATASLYVTPRRPLRSSIFEVSPRRTSTGQTGTTSRNQGDRQTSATLRYALEATPARDPRTSGRSGRPSGPERTPSDSLGDRPTDQSQTSFLDVEADPPAELDERFPAIEPAASSPAVQQHVVEDQSTEQKESRNVNETWLESGTQYKASQQSHSTPPELASVRGINVDQLQQFVRDRSGTAVPDGGQYLSSPPAQGDVEGRQGWQTGIHASHDNMPVSRQDLIAAVETLQDEMKTIREQLGRVTSELVVRSSSTEAHTTRNELPSNALHTILEIDALVHHVVLGERDQDEVLSQRNLTIVTDRIREWEGVIRGRTSLTDLANS